MIVTVGIQGPPGPTDFGKARISRVAGESLAAFIVVMVGSDGKVYRASKSTPGHINRVLGITLAAAAADAAVDVHLFGEATNGAWSFDTTKLIWLGDDGALTQSAPTSGFLMVIGYPTSAGSMFVIPGACAILASAGAGDAGKAVALDGTGKLALSLLPATLTGKDADTVDGCHAGNAAGKVPVLDGSALLPLAQVPATLTGKDADTVDGYHAVSLAKAGANSDITSLAGGVAVRGTGTVAVFGETSGDCAIAIAKSSNGGVVVPVITMSSVIRLGAGSGYGVVGTEILGGGAAGLRVNASGCVGIGTNTPGAKLEVAGGSEMFGLIVEGDGVVASARIALRRANSTTSTGNLDWIGNTNVVGARIGVNDDISGTMQFKLGGVGALADTKLILYENGNLGLMSTQFGGGAGVIGIANATSVPSSNPSGGVVVYVDPADGKLKYRSASGETRTLSYTT